MLVHLLTSLDLEKTRDSVIAECRAYYHICLITYLTLHLLRCLNYVRLFFRLFFIVYSVIKLRLPDDNLINALTDLAEAKIF